MDNICSDAHSARRGILFDDMLIAGGGCGWGGMPERLLEAIQAAGTQDLTFASNNAGIDNEGIGKMLRRTGGGPAVAEGKEVKRVDGEDHVLEQGIFADLAIIKGWTADESGNLIVRKTVRNCNHPVATAGRGCIAEGEEIVSVGSLDPDAIHLPGIYVNRLIPGAPYDKTVEQRTVREREAA
ncbi:MAG: CoA transferase subunit A [Novosphingobium sp.]